MRVIRNQSGNNPLDGTINDERFCRVLGGARTTAPILSPSTTRVEFSTAGRPLPSISLAPVNTTTWFPTSATERPPAKRNTTAKNHWDQAFISLLVFPRHIERPPRTSTAFRSIC